MSKRKEKTKETILISIDEDLKRQIKQYALDHGISVSGLLRSYMRSLVSGEEAPILTDSDDISRIESRLKELEEKVNNLGVVNIKDLREELNIKPYVMPETKVDTID